MNIPQFNTTGTYSLEPEVLVTPTTTNWSISDYLGTIKMRTSVARRGYTITPGLYSIGQPNRQSEVLVTANYKLSFDILRRNLKEVDAWILVLDTKGINVWCAAGKGTFGTEELIQRINATSIASRIDHKRLILPQLGAPGVAAHKVKQATGLNIKYGPVRAEDIREYLNTGLKIKPSMRRVQFNLKDRLILSPVEIAYTSKYLFYAILFILLLSTFDNTGLNLNNLLYQGLRDSIVMILAFLSGTFFGPILLPYLPFKSFSIKGAFSGALFWILSIALFYKGELSLFTIGFLPAFLALGSFFTMNFTGASTYTSLSGVQKEMKYALPAQIASGIVSIILLVASKFI